MENGNYTYLIVIGAFLIGFYILLFYVPIGLWYTAKVSGVRITLMDLVFMRMRKVAPTTIVKAMIMAAKGGIEVQKDVLAHCMAGGNVENVVTGMIFAKNNNVQLTFKEASQMDLAQKDIIKELSK